jgi:predicted nuclease of predicted toxin-antitoxin system
MKFKLDENFGTRTQQLFQAAGHEVQTVRSQNLQGCSDQHLFKICSSEKYCLVTLDLDFAEVTRFPPAEASGVVILRVSRNPSVTVLEQLIRQFLQALNQMSVERKLWIVEIGRIRIHQPEVDDKNSCDNEHT